MKRSIQALVIPLLVLAVTLITVMRVGGSAPDQECPSWLRQSGIANDMGLLADAVSWEFSDKADGVCGSYKMVHEGNGLYQTRVRVYEKLSTGDHYIVFRPTQQNGEGKRIHLSRELEACSFIPNCKGKVHARFQHAFMSLLETVKDWEPYLQKKVYVGGHSLGGAMQQFMALYLWKVHNKLPEMSLGLAGPFIGNKRFHKEMQTPLHKLIQDTWWQVETVNVAESKERDNTVESYNVGRSLYINRDLMCSFLIKPLPMPAEAYGMHDIKQYRLWLSGTDCSL